MLRRFAATLAALGLLASLVTPTYAYCVPGRTQQRVANDGISTLHAQPGVHFNWIGATVVDDGEYVYSSADSSYAWIEIHSATGTGIARVGVRYTPNYVYVYRYVTGDDGSVYVNDDTYLQPSSEVPLSISVQWSTKKPDHINAATLNYGSLHWTYNLTVDDAWEPVYAVLRFRQWNRANSFGGSSGAPFVWSYSSYVTQYGTGSLSGIPWSASESWMRHSGNSLWDLAC